MIIKNDNNNINWETKEKMKNNSNLNILKRNEKQIKN